MKVRILKNPIGLYRLSYEVGEVVDLPDAQAKEMIETKHAEATKEPVKTNPGKDYHIQSETAQSKVKPEKR